MDKSAFSLGLVVGLLLVIVVTAWATPLQKRGADDEGQLRGVGSKRTFCNAFTGCGRKRSDGPLPLPLREREQIREREREQREREQRERDYSDYGGGDRDRDHEGGDNFEDGGAMEDVARDILAEARLWEALQARNSLRPSLRGKGGYRGSGNGSRRPLEEQLPN